jgi:diadenosine tetraphosphate (Ap4A) HIT family hydrolase
VTAVYDNNNIFARILRGEIQVKPIVENAHAMAFDDINPKAPIHKLVIPKGAYTTMDELVARGTPDEIVDFWKAVADVIVLTGVDKTGYRLVSNNGADGGQEVPHVHVHILGGKHLKHPQQEAE